jgi:hypothetical protein
MMLERDGSLYEEAIDPISSGRIYTETDQAIIHYGEENNYLNLNNKF